MRAICVNQQDRTALIPETIVAGFALLAIVIAQWMLSAGIHGANYTGSDGKIAQAMILTALKFAKPFEVTNLNPIEGIGSQLLPMNVWANPAYWPFAFLDKKQATDLSALIAFAVFASASYIMARCFDVPVVPSAIGAQLCIVLFAPTVLLLQLPTVFCLNAGNAVVFAPYMVALGVLSRLEVGSWRTFGMTTAAIFALLFYSIYCDPLWTMIVAISWSIPFAVITVSPLHLKTILVRGAALGCCFALLLLTRAAEYLYSLSQFTARVQFSGALDRTRTPELVSALFNSPNMKYFYLVWWIGWILGLLTLRGRPKTFIIAGLAACLGYLGYSVVYLLLANATWVPPIPLYVEQCLFVLFSTAGVAGYWGALRTATGWLVPRSAALLNLTLARRTSEMRGSNPTVVVQPSLPSRSLNGEIVSPGAALRLERMRTPFRKRLIQLGFSIATGIAAVAVVPAIVINFAANHSQQYVSRWDEPWQNAPELEDLLSDRIGLTAGQRFRGSLHLWNDPDNLKAKLWSRGIPTIDEYSQLVTPQIIYFVYALLEKEVRGMLNWFYPFPDKGCCWLRFWKAAQMLGVRYVVGDGPLAIVEEQGYASMALPRYPAAGGRDIWQIYELPRPNVGDYSPTEVITAGSSKEIFAAMGTPDFDFTKQVVLSAALSEPLVPARDMRLTIIRGGLHLSGHSDGISLIVLPQQFSHCLRARDGRTRLMRANFMMTGIIFSGDIDTDIVFDYGIFTPGCRWADLSDMRRLQVRIDLRMPHLEGNRLFLDWPAIVARLGEIATAIK
jgi:hypothetical protein